MTDPSNMELMRHAAKNINTQAAELDLTKRISALNDMLRKTGQGGLVKMTHGVAALPDHQRNRAIRAMVQFCDFNSDNDPYGEHDFGAFTVEDERFNFKIDYYDKKMEMHSDDAADPGKTTRVLLLMFASEY